MNIEYMRGNLERLIAERDQVIQDMESLEIEVTEEQFDEYLYELYGLVDVCGCQYDPGRALRELDPTAYRCAKSDYEASIEIEETDEYRELQEQLEDLEADIEELEQELQDAEDDDEL